MYSNTCVEYTSIMLGSVVLTWYIVNQSLKYLLGFNFCYFRCNQISVKIYPHK